jgi:hypothetical protein
VTNEAEPDGRELKRAGVTLLELEPGQCCFIVDERAAPVRFCGEPTVMGGNWCAQHHLIVYVPPRETRRSERS